MTIDWPSTRMLRPGIKGPHYVCWFLGRYLMLVLFASRLRISALQLLSGDDITIHGSSGKQGIVARESLSARGAVPADETAPLSPSAI